MALVTADRVRETTTTTGTGQLTLAGAVVGYRTLASQMSNNDTCYYAISHQTANEWECGLGTYNSTNKMTRTTVHASSNSNNAVNFSAGTKDVFITLTKTQMDTLATLTGTQTLTNKTISGASNTVTNVSLSTGVTGTLPLTSGGTGQVTAQAALNALAGSVTGGSYLRGNGTNVVMSTIQAGDVPTLNQNTTGTASNVTGTVAIANGGTGQTTAAGAYNALTPMTTLGDLVYESSSGTASRLAGNTTTTKQFLSQTGTGTVSAAPAWATLAKADVGLSNVENTALSTWAGGSSITTVGTVTVGAWNGSAVAVAYGGTGTSTGSITGTGALTFSAGGSNNGITLTPTGTGTVAAPAIKESVYTITDGASVDISPANGGIQVWTLGANRTPTATNFAEGQSVTLMIDDGTAYAITWTSISPTWVGGVAPTLATSGFTVIELWKRSTVIYGALVGNV